MLRLTVRALALVAALVATSNTWASENNTPFIDLIDVDGQPVTTEADVGHGKWQLVMIWAIDCHICKEMKPKISAFHNKHKDDDAVVFGLALDGPSKVAEVKQYIDDYNVSFPSYIGRFTDITSTFEVNNGAPFAGTPTYLLFNPVGELMAIDFGLVDIDALERFIERNT